MTTYTVTVSTTPASTTYTVTLPDGELGQCAVLIIPTAKCVKTETTFDDLGGTSGGSEGTGGY
jgi:hypothetical protein